jgi:hypothetical protein
LVRIRIRIRGSAYLFGFGLFFPSCAGIKGSGSSRMHPI